MGLAEHKAVRAFEGNKYPKLKQEIDAADGFEVPIEVKRETLTTENYAELYEEAFPKVFFCPLIAAIKAVCIDDLGKEAIKDGLEKNHHCRPRMQQRHLSIWHALHQLLRYSKSGL